MNCVDDSLLQMLVEGDIEEPARDIVYVHLRQCATCRAKVSGYKQLMWDLRQQPDTPLPQELDVMHTQLMEAWASVTRERKEERRSTRSLVPSWAGYSVLWTRHLPHAERVGDLVSKAGKKLIDLRPLVRRVRRKGGGRR